MANLTYELRGKSPRKQKLDYILKDGELISKQPINFNLIVKMDPNRPQPVDCEVEIKMRSSCKNFYVFENGLHNIKQTFDKKKKDFRVNIGGHVIMLSENSEKMPLTVYLTVKGDGGNTYPDPLKKGKHRWCKGEVTLTLNVVLSKLKEMNKNLKDLL